MEHRTIGADKLNELRHVRFLKIRGRHRIVDGRAREAHLAQVSRGPGYLRPAFEWNGVATWTRPEGGYFVSLDVLDGCARRVIALAKDAGITVVPAAQASRTSKDPHDRNIPIAPTFPSLGGVTNPPRA